MLISVLNGVSTLVDGVNHLWMTSIDHCTEMSLVFYKEPKSRVRSRLTDLYGARLNPSRVCS